MDSLFGDDGINDLFNDNQYEEDNNLPSGDENEGRKEGAEQGVKVEPKKRISRARQRLTIDTLTGSRGLHTIEQYFKDIKYKGKGCEKQDLDEVLKRLQHWGHRLYPIYTFDDILKNIERLGKKKILQNHMSRYRLGMLENQLIDENCGEAFDDEAEAPIEDEPFDEFDALLNEQIAISRIAPRTPASSSRQINTPSTLVTPSFSRDNVVISTPFSDVHRLDTSDLAQPLPPSQPSTPSNQQTEKVLTNEQLALIAENRRKAQERLRAKKLERERQQNIVDGT